MPEPLDTAPETEAKNHSYVGNTIPWYVRLLWLGFWVLCIAYVFQWLIPALKKEIIHPP